MPGGSDTLKPSAFIPVCTAACLLVGSTSLYFVFTCPWLAVTICPAVPPCSAIIFLFVLANFTMATFMDAGVLPMASEDEDKDDEFRAPLYKNVEVKGVQVRMKWCASCHFYRPPRCSHCSVCDRCVEDFDHHCPWVNNCIGRRNYRYFFLFLLSLTVHMIGVFTFGLIYILHHMDDLWALHCTVTLVVVSISGLFLIPVLGLTGFHFYLVSRGRTTNEQVTGKFQGGVNPFTRGCCNNLEYLVCSPIPPKYTARPCKKTVIHLQPPFLRLEIERKKQIKVRDNGIQSRDKQLSSGAVESSNVKQLKTPPPLPPKPDHGLLRSHVAALDELGHHTKSIIPVSIPTVPQLRPVLEAISRGSSPIPPEKLLKTSDNQDNNKGPNHCLESKESPVRSSHQPGMLFQPPLHTSMVPGPLQHNSLTLNSRSLTLKNSGRYGSKSQLPAMHVDGLGCNPPPGIIANPSLIANHGSSSLSYDNLMHPADPQLIMQRGVPPVSYHPHFMTVGTDGPVLRKSPQAYSPVFVGITRQSPQPRDTSPSMQGPSSRDPSPSLQGIIHREHSPAFQVKMPRDLATQSVASRDIPPPGLMMRDMASQSLQDSLRDLLPPDATPPRSAAARYDNFSKTIMASFHERRELEERDRILRLQARSHALYGDMGIYDIPCRRSLPPDNNRPPGSRGPTPPAYGSREFLMSTGILGYGMRSAPLSSSSTSSLTRGPKTIGSPLQSSSSSSLQTRGRSSSPGYCPTERPNPSLASSTSTIPRLSSSTASSATPHTSYATMKRSSLQYSSERKDSVTHGAPK
ncbi:probable palmitoyltransferase ZDHHC8 [Gouania willdenowi]|uniref:probable palmitoyltransferase ZDHHC8 n=1 Tax=Gouania willdenowi TaxID=441366 RepID=UPI0010554737|nr:probable palmitoyltransferase ZDHHC8 [Gouania willdenowi]